MERVINVPKRSIGEKSVKDLLELSRIEGVRPMEIIERIAQSAKPIMGIKSGVQNSLRKFVHVIQEVRQMAVQCRPVSEILEKLIDLLHYEAHLRKEPDFDQRWENVRELINFSTIVSAQGFEEQFSSPNEQYSPSVDTQSKNGIRSTTATQELSVSKTTEYKEKVDLDAKKGIGQGGHHPARRTTTKKEVIDLDSDEDEDPVSSQAPLFPAEGDGSSASLAVTKSPLQIFLEASTLSTDLNQDEADGNAPKVTIATTHAAKG